MRTTTVLLRPRFEGSNICTWIGFKHVMYVVEEAVLDHFRQHGLVPRELYEEHGLCLEVIDSSVRILHALHMDDQVEVRIEPKTKAGAKEITVAVTLTVEREGKPVKALTGKVLLMLRQDDSQITGGAGAVAPHFLQEHSAPTLRRAGHAVLPLDQSVSRERAAVAPDVLKALGADSSNSFVWKWHVPYFYCHYNDRMQHNGYLRLMEEVVDLFLAERGISIRSLLEDNKWIPVVPTARVEIVDEARMEETIYTVYTVEEIFKDTTYRSRMDCYVERNGALVKTATGSIVHGYAVIENRKDWSLVQFDQRTIDALSGKPA
ncbi:hypothetical protein [Janthinobacterium fluminis]|uniref:Acyl-CoA thioesterase FadM n=1 Tax=Janthinobacterium fluminis TaxID=2987524 RepID=A0ABT5K1U0_9BURK|nr:hypothetical protein [Janthinobacterium fluminis]MDC8758949.1 hypothetical protein [Janthinobacterium fluminis]